MCDVIWCSVLTLAGIGRYIVCTIESPEFAFVICYWVMQCSYFLEAQDGTASALSKAPSLHCCYLFMVKKNQKKTCSVPISCSIGRCIVRTIESPEFAFVICFLVMQCSYCCYLFRCSVEKPELTLLSFVWVQCSYFLQAQDGTACALSKAPS